MLTGAKFDAFIASCNGLSSTIQATYSQLGDGSPRDFFVKELFWKRNTILHSGKIQFGEPEAELGMQIAMTMLQVIDVMDRAKHKARFG